MTTQVFEYILFNKETNKIEEEGKTVALDQNKATMKILMGFGNKYENKTDELDLLIRPF